MNLNRLTPIHYTDQLKETVEWYVNALGFYCNLVNPLLKHKTFYI